MADNNVGRRHAPDTGRRTNDHPASRNALADIISAGAGQVERDPMREESAETLPRDPMAANEDAVVRKALVPETSRNLARKHRADSAVDVADVSFDPHRLTRFKRRARRLDQLLIKGIFKPVVLAIDIAQRRALGNRRLIEDA